MNIRISHLICFIFGLFIESVLTASMINGKLTTRCSKLKFKRKDGKTQYLFGPDDKRDFLTITYSLGEDQYDEVVPDIYKEGDIKNE